MVPKISIIVPVYNAERFLYRCIDSILAQTFTDFELLLIDDGSPDRSGEICDEYARKDSRIRVFHKENGGVSSARQMGIEVARGEYSIHVDSDDWIEEDMLYCMYQKVIDSGNDIVILDYYRNDKYMAEILPDNHIQAIYDMLSGKIRGVMWNKLVKHSLYKANNIAFPQNINFCEDVYVCALLYLYTDKIVHVPKAYYHYVDRIDSITRSLNKSIIIQRADFVNLISRVLINNGLQTKCLLWHKIDLKWLMFDSLFFSYNEYKSYFADIFRQYSYTEYPQYLKNILILYLSNNRLGWSVFRKIRNIKNKK